MLDGLDPAQRQAVTTDAQPLCILAGAGSGKTRVLTRRIAWRIAHGSALPQHVLALTFTRRAAGELGSRLAALGVREQVAVGTFHALAYAQLRRLWADRDERPPALLDRKVRLLVPLLPRHPEPVPAADVAAEIEWAKARMVPPHRYEAEAAAAGRRPPVPPGAMAALYARYEEEKRRRGLVDFDDLLAGCAEALEADPRFAATQRWRFRHLFVDEFQDVNPLQFRLLTAWLGDRSDLCVVGDPNQAIYAWNGADPSYLTAFPRRFRGATVVRLDRNYRSSPQVLAVADAVLAGGGPGPAGARALGRHGPVPAVTSWPTDREEAEGVARALRRGRGGGRPWSQAAVLTRTHAQIVLFEEALRAAGIPYRVRGAARFLDHPEVRRALADLQRRPAPTPLAHVVPDLVEEAAGAADLDHDDERRRHLEGLVRLAREHLAAEPSATVAAFLAWLRATLRGDEGEGGGDGSGSGPDAVTLATLHAAKGLEWDAVFLAGLEQGLVPIGHADTAEARAEERRLLYVGITRARRELHCSWAERRTFGARTMARSPSPWLERIEAAVAALAEAGPVGDWRRHLAENRARVRELRPHPRGTHARPRTGTSTGTSASASAGSGNGATTGPPRLGTNPDPDVLAALRAWRATMARASAVPAHVVLHDTTLAAVAEARPRDRAALLALPGVGPLKAERYGDALLSLVAASADG